MIWTALKFGERMWCLSSCTDVLHRPLILIISRCCFAEDGKEMYQHVKRTCKASRVIDFAHWNFPHFDYLEIQRAISDTDVWKFGEVTTFLNIIPATLRTSCPSIGPSIHPFFHLSICPSVHPCIPLSVCSSVSVCFYLSAYLSIDPPQ